MDKDRSIIAQSAGKDAVELVKAIVGVTGDTDTSAVFDIYEDLKTRIFNSTLALAGAESVVENVEGTSSGSSGRSYQRRSSGGNDNPGTLEIRSGKHAGKTIAEVADEDPDYLEWAAQNMNNAFLKGKIRDFLAAA